MLTECNQSCFSFAPHFSGRVAAEFSAQRVSGDGGALLLREADRRSTCWTGSRTALAMAARRCWSGTSCRRCWRSAFTGWRWATRTSTIMSSYAPIRCWGCWPSSGNWTSRWPERARRGPAASATGRCTNDSRTREEHPSYKLGSMPVNSVGPPAY